ncbi:hypothetical protein ACQP1G_37835 [Nocardia sp. CA-107356]
MSPTWTAWGLTFDDYSPKLSATRRTPITRHMAAHLPWKKY